MADNKIHLKVVSPTRIVLEEDVDMVIMRGVEGDMGILPGHEQLTTLLANGVLKYIIGDEENEATVLGGFTEVRPDAVTILTDASELPQDIDEKRAEEAKKRAEERLAAASKSTVDLLRAENSLQRALVRLEVVGSRGKKF